MFPGERAAGRLGAAHKALVGEQGVGAGLIDQGRGQQGDWELRKALVEGIGGELSRGRSRV